MASVLATISEMLIMGAASLKVIFDVVTAYPFEHNFQVRKGDKDRIGVLWKLPRGRRKRVCACEIYVDLLLSIANAD